VSIDAMNAAIATGWSGAEATVLAAHEPQATYGVKLPAASNAAGE
jgi:hypothetical protein